MHDALLKYFNEYSEEQAPFMHQQLAEWSKSRPLNDLQVLHHVPVVPNTLLKIACLIAAGADVTVTNPISFMRADPRAVNSLHEACVRYVENLNEIKGKSYDLYFDCGGELYQTLGTPNIGAIELTGSGDQYYRLQELGFPVISIDRTLTKQLETVFGCAESINQAITQEKQINPIEKSWIIFGFGKIGRGLAYFCVQHQAPVIVVDICEKQRLLAEQLGIKTIDPHNIFELEQAVAESDIVVTATGRTAIMNAYPHQWFQDKILANMGIYDEYGDHFSEQEVLNNKKAVNFVLEDPTPMKYIDPEFYIHNIAALSLIDRKLSSGVHGVSKQLDQNIIQRWCTYHKFSSIEINKWFITQDALS